jgi:hypothetical protein
MNLSHNLIPGPPQCLAEIPGEGLGRTPKSGLLSFGEFFRLAGELLLAGLGAKIIGFVLEVIHILTVMRFQIHIADRIDMANRFFFFSHKTHSLLSGLFIKLSTLSQIAPRFLSDQKILSGPAGMNRPDFVAD